MDKHDAGQHFEATEELQGALDEAAQVGAPPGRVGGEQVFQRAATDIGKHQPQFGLGVHHVAHQGQQVGVQRDVAQRFVFLHLRGQVGLLGHLDDKEKTKIDNDKTKCIMKNKMYNENKARSGVAWDTLTTTT